MNAGAADRLRRPRPELLVAAGALAAAPVAGLLTVALASGMTALSLSIVAFIAVAVAVLALPPRGVASSRTWVVGYLLLQFPVRAVFLLSDPEEAPPIYRVYPPGSGLERMLAPAMVQAVAGLVVLAAAYAVGGLRVPHRRADPEARIDGRRVRVLFAVALALLPIEVLQASSQTTSGGDFIIAMPGLAAAGASAVVCYAFARRPSAHVVAFLAAIAYNAARVLLLSSKLSLLAAGLAIIIGLSTRAAAARPALGRSLRTGVVAGLAALAASYVFAAAAPGSEHGDIGPAMLQGATNAVSRSYGVDSLLAIDGYLDAGGPAQNGASLAGLVWSWVPRQLWPDKPKSFSVEFGEKVFWFSSISGDSYFAPGYFGEWVINFGSIGLVVGAIGFGVALTRVDAETSLPRRLLWIIVVVHLVEGSLVAQFWLAVPFVVGGYWVLAGRPRPDDRVEPEHAVGAGKVDPVFS